MDFLKKRTPETAMPFPLKRILNHPKLEQYYPELTNNLKVKFYEGPKEHGGFIKSSHTGLHTININYAFEGGVGVSTELNVRRLLLHGTPNGIQGENYSILSTASKELRTNDHRENESDTEKGQVGGENQKVLLVDLKRARNRGRAVDLYKVERLRIDHYTSL